MGLHHNSKALATGAKALLVRTFGDLQRSRLTVPGR